MRESEEKARVERENMGDDVIFSFELLDVRVHKRTNKKCVTLTKTY